MILDLTRMMKFIKRLLPLCLLYFIIVCCVPNKRIQYLQNEQEPKRDQIKGADSLHRYYNTQFKKYLLKPLDMISLRVASVTPSEFDFVQKYEEQLGLIRKLTQYEQHNMAGAMNQRMMGGGGMMGGEDGINPVFLDGMQTGFVIDEDGFLELPLVGKVQLAGNSLQTAESIIKEKMKGYFETPVVRMQLLSFHFTILGEVNNEGRYTIFDTNPNVFDAITLSGNLNDFADRSRIKIIRTEGQVAKVFYINMLDESLLAQPGFYLQPNDLIIVPPLPARASRMYTLPTTATGIGLFSSLASLIILIITLNSR